MRNTTVTSIKAMLLLSINSEYNLTADDIAKLVPVYRHTALIIQRKVLRVFVSHMYLLITVHDNCVCPHILYLLQ